MNHGKQQGEVNLVAKVRESEGVRVAQARLDPVEQSCATCPPLQHVQHLLLKVNTDHSATWADESRQGQAKEPHGGPDIQNARARCNMRGQNRFGVLKECAERIG
jgi:hypothetical protein